MPKEKTVQLKNGKTRVISLSFDEQVAIFECLFDKANVLRGSAKMKNGIIHASVRQLDIVKKLQDQFSKLIFL